MNPVIRILLAIGSCAVVAAITPWSVAAAEPALGVGAGSVDHPSVAPTEAREDSAVAVEDARLPTHAAVGRFTGTMVCTAAIVLHPRIIITAAHCIASRDGLASRTKPIFQPAKRAGRDLDRFEATVWAVGSQQRFTAQSAHDAASDWAILVLDRVPVGMRPLRLRIRSAEELTRLQRQILMPSYVIDAAGTLSLSLDPGCSVRGMIWGVLLHDCKASPGTSGAPLLIRDRQWYAVVGVHTGSIFASDEEGHIATSIGNSASGAWSFTEALTALSRRLQGDAADDVAYHGH